MGEMIRFSKIKRNRIRENDDLKIVRSMLDSNLSVSLKILSEEIYIVIRVLLQEKKDTQDRYHQSLRNNDNEGATYWKQILDVLGGLVNKFKAIDQPEDLFEELSFFELDCLVGVIEQSLQERYLLKLQLIDDDIPVVTELLEMMYQRIIPIYMAKRDLFEKNNSIAKS